MPKKEEKHDPVEVKGESVKVVTTVADQGIVHGSTAMERHVYAKSKTEREMPPDPKTNPVTTLGLTTTAEGEAANKAAAKRTVDLANLVQPMDVPDSMKQAMIAQAVDDDTAKHMERDWKAGKVVVLGNTTWGTPKPKE